MNRKIIDFYLIVSNLKNVVRTGWEEVKIPKENIESVMDHVGGTMLLAMAINNEKNLDLDMNKVYTMILVKELAKAYTNYEYSVLNPNLKEDYNRIIKDIFGNLSNGDYLFDIYNEYTLMNSKESKFVFKLSKAVVNSVTSSSSLLCFFPKESFSAICYFLASNALVIPEILFLVN